MGYKVTLGAIPSPVDIRDWKIKQPQAVNYPDEFILDDLPDVLNQGSIGSCVAHVIAAIIAWHHFRQTKNKKKMSIIGTYGNRRNTTYKGSGMIARDAMLAIMKYGCPGYDQLPGNVEVEEAIRIFEEYYCKLSEEELKEIIQYAFTSIARCTTNDDIKYALVNHGPVLFVTKWYDDFKYKDGILNSESRSTSSGAHCMFIYGWTTRDDKLYWLIQNSWGKSWGKLGRALFPADIALVEAWDIADNFVEGTDEYKKPCTSKIGDFLCKIANWIINAFLQIKNK